MPRAVFQRHLQNLVETVEAKSGLAQDARTRAISAIALCVGGLVLARAVKDRGFSADILDACREAVIREVDHA
jgi:hypothetical protein